MRKNNSEDTIKLFGMTNHMLELELNRIEKKFDIDLGRKKSVSDADKIYYPQFALEIRKEAHAMSKNYEVFYCLERTIRDMTSKMLDANIGEDWWNSAGTVPEQVKQEVKKRISKEIEAAVTIRSKNPIDFTTFGELGEIIKSNWSIFNQIFKNMKAVESVMAKLNTLRAPIAHCTLLAEDEELRLQLSVRDWFRLME